MQHMQYLTKGANAPVVANKVCVTLSWSSQPNVEVDISALLCGADHRVSSDRDFVFFNQPNHPSGAVQQLGHSHDSEGSNTDTVRVDLGRVPASVGSVRIAASTTATFGRVSGLVAHVIDAVSGSVQLEYAIDATNETAMVAGELYRRAGAWKFRAVGQGYTDGLAGLARDFGIVVDEAPTSRDLIVDWLNPPVPAGYEI